MPANPPPASSLGRDDVIRVLGELDDITVLDILALHPTVEDLEEVAVWTSGEEEVLVREGHTLSGIAAQIIDLLPSEPEDMPDR
jgi:hypothetical protein